MLCAYLPLKMMQTFIQKEVCTVFGTQWIKHQEYFRTIAKIVSSCNPSLSWQPLHVPALVASLCPGHAVQCTHSPALICFRQRWRLWNTPWTLKKRLFLWSEKSECLQVVHAMQCQWTSSAVGLGEFCSLLWVFVLGCCHSPLAADLAWRHPSPCQRQALACSFLWIRRERHIQGREEQLYVSQCHNHRCVFSVCVTQGEHPPHPCAMGTKMGWHSTGYTGHMRQNRHRAQVCLQQIAPPLVHWDVGPSAPTKGRVAESICCLWGQHKLGRLLDEVVLPHLCSEAECCTHS